MDPNTITETVKGNEAPTVKPTKNNKKISFKTKLIIIHTIATMIVGGLVVAYLWRNDQANKQKTTDASTIKTLEDKVKRLDSPIYINNENNRLLKQRDTQRKNDLSILATAVTSYQSNNKGESPDVDDWDDLLSLYVDSNNFKDPLGSYYVLSEAALLPTIFNSNNPVIKISRSSRCNDDNSITSSTIRSFAFQMRLESNEVYCINN